jgi:hypothetical protein
MIKWKRVFSDLVTGTAEVGKKKVVVFIQKTDNFMAPHKVAVQLFGADDVVFDAVAHDVPRAKQLAQEYVEKIT